MSNNIIENTIESFSIDLLQQFGYEYLYGPDIAPDGEHPERSSHEVVLLREN